MVKPELCLTGLTFYADVNFLDDPAPAAELLRRSRDEGWIRLQVTDTVGTELMPDEGSGETRTASGADRSDLQEEALGFAEVYGPLILGHSRLGSSILGDSTDEDRVHAVFKILKPNADWYNTRRNNVRDAMQIATAIRYNGDGFVTRDENMLKKSAEIADRFQGFAVLSLDLARDRGILLRLIFGLGWGAAGGVGQGCGPAVAPVGGFRSLVERAGVLGGPGRCAQSGEGGGEVVGPGPVPVEFES